MIESYRFGKITVDGKDYYRDIVIFPDHVKENWWREEGHRLKEKDIDDVIDFQPDILVVGQGTLERMKITDQVRRLLEERNIVLIAEKTDIAKDEFNRLAGEGKKVVAALHLTC